jgi:chromosome segregation ATPase
MSEEIESLKKEINDLKIELEEEKKNNNLEDIKAKYEEVIEAKNKEISELTKSNQIIKEQMNNTVDNLNDEVKLKLEQSEQLAELNKQVEELLQDKAEATVDTFIQQGKILPAQRETALKLCLSDNDTFLNLYKDAKPIIDTTQTPKSKKVNDSIVDGLKDYFKN